MPQPARTTKVYSFERNQLIINGIQINGYGDEGGIEYEYSSNMFEVTVGADGEVTASYLANDLIMATVTLKETSDSHVFLANLTAAQRLAARTGTGILLPISWLHLDPVIGEIVQTNNAIVMQRPTPNKGRVAGDRTYQFALPYGALEPLFGAAAVLPFP